MNRNSYYKYFQENIKPQIKLFEQYRMKTVKKVLISSIIMFILGLLFAYIYIYISWKYNAAALLLPFMLFFMYVFFIKSIICIHFIFIV